MYNVHVNINFLFLPSELGTGEADDAMLGAQLTAQPREHETAKNIIKIK